MLGQKQLQAALTKIQLMFDKVNQKFIRKIAGQVKKIGELNSSSYSQLSHMAEMTSNIREIKQDLSQTLHTSQQAVEDLLTEAMRENIADPRFVQAFKSGKDLAPEERKRLVQYTNLVYMHTAGTMENLSRTTLIDRDYKNAVDQAILAVNSGLQDYQSATRDILRSTGMNGIRVQYPSGQTRRLDTAVRMNVIDGAKQVSQQGAIMIGEALNYDAYELTAHLHSAPDHEPVQGHIFLKEEFEKMQRGYDFKDWKGRRFLGFQRPIGQWNCMHLIMPFSTIYSTPQYTERQLQAMAEQNMLGCEFDGEWMTLYEASQLMRRIETQVRHLKDCAIGAMVAGDDRLRRECQWKINTLARKYGRLAKAAGLAEQRNRMTVEGFKPFKESKKQ